MSRLEEIKKETGKKANKMFLLTGIIFMLLGIGLSVAGIIVFVKAAGAKDNICVQDADDLKVNKWYTIETNTLLTAYARGDDGVDYITWIGENYENASYISIYVPSSKTEKAGRITSATKAYLEGQTSTLSNEWLSGKGYIRKMEDKEKKIYEDALREYGIPIQDRVMYTFSMVSPWTAMGEMGVRRLFIFGCLFFLFGIVFIIIRLTGVNMKTMKKAMQTNGITERELEQDMETALTAANVYVGNKYIYISQATPELFVVNKLIWVYPTKTVTTNRAYGIKTGETTTYGVCYVDRAGKKKTGNTRSEDESKEIVSAVHVRAPYLICGYNQNVENAITSGNLNAVVSYVDQQRLAVSDQAVGDDRELYMPQSAPQSQPSPYAPKPEMEQGGQNAPAQSNTQGGQNAPAQQNMQGGQQYMPPQGQMNQSAPQGQPSPYAPKPEMQQGGQNAPAQSNTQGGQNAPGQQNMQGGQQYMPPQGQMNQSAPQSQPSPYAPKPEMQQGGQNAPGQQYMPPQGQMNQSAPQSQPGLQEQQFAYEPDSYAEEGTTVLQNPFEK